jgi:threonine/homoserine/homoserine lactone efflux protein
MLGAMPVVSTLTVFVVVVAAFAAVPGPSNLYVVAQGLRAGRGAAMLAAAGCALGAMVYVAATTFGLAALLASSATMLSLLHYLGGAYLLVLAVRAFRTRATDHRAGSQDAALDGRFLRQGMLVELSNPKVALFFLALFPQFVHAERGATWSQILVLGAVFCVVGLISDSLYAIGSGALRARMRRSKRLLDRSAKVSGTLYLGLGAWAIWSGTQTRTS